jgi:hypothetical protein
VVKNANGDTRIDAVVGDLRISAGNGDLAVGRADGNVTASASAAYGEIRIAQVSRGTVAIKTGFGEIAVGLGAAAARLDLFTSFGRVRNSLNPADSPDPADAVLAVSARTNHGDITIRPA